MSGMQRRTILHVLMVFWGFGTYLGIYGLFAQIPHITRGYENWKYMIITSLLANIGVLIYGILRSLTSRISDAFCIYGLLTIGTISLFLSAFLYDRQILIGDTEHPQLLLFVFFAALVSNMSSVLFYPYLRYFRDVYLATFLVGQSLGGCFSMIMTMVQNWKPQHKPSHSGFSEPLFDTTVFLSVLAVLSAVSLASFIAINNLKGFSLEKTSSNRARTEKRTIVSLRWMCVLAVTAIMTALLNIGIPHMMGRSCIPHGPMIYALAAVLSGLARPAAFLAGVWLRPVNFKVLSVILTLSLVPSGYIVATTLISTQEYIDTKVDIILIITSFVAVSGMWSYAIMCVYWWARCGGAAGMRACGAVALFATELGKLLMYFVFY